MMIKEEDWVDQAHLEERDPRYKWNRRSGVGSYIMAGAVVVALLCCFAPLWGQAKAADEEQVKQEETVSKSAKTSLAQLARRERERRAANQQAVRVITNKDLRSMGRAKIGTSIAPAPKVETKAESSEAGKEEEEKPVENKGEDLEVWKSAFQEARTLLENAVNRFMVLQLRMNNVQNSYYRETDGTTKQKLQEEMAKTMEELKLSEETEREARARLADLVQQAKQAGLLPGQIRDLVGELPDSASITKINPE